MSRFTLAALVSLSLGCGPHADPAQQRPIATSVDTLWRDYRDTPNRARDAWTGQRVRVVLVAGDYRCGRGQVTWHNGHPTGAACVVFLCDPPADNTSDLELVSTCRGTLADTWERAQRITYHVEVADCLTAQRP